MKLLLHVILVVLPFCAYAEKKGQERIDSLIKALHSAQRDTGRVEILVEIAKRYSNVDANAAMIYGDWALSLADTLGWDKGRSDADYALAWICRHRSEFAKALDYANKALQIAEELGRKKEMALDYQVISVVYLEQSNYPLALQNANKSLQIAEGIHDERLIAGNLTNIGIIYDDQGDYSKALEYHNQALAKFHKLGEKYTIATSLSNIGQIYTKLRQYRRAIDTLLEAEKLQTDLSGKMSASKVLGYIGDAHKGLREYSKALDYMGRALALAHGYGDRNGEAEKLQMIGSLYLAAATDSFRAGDPIFRNSKKQNLDSAISAVTRSADIHKEIGNLKDLAENYETLSTCMSLAGDDARALEYFKLATRNKDSLFSRQTEIALANLDARRELELKDNQMKLTQVKLAKSRFTATASIIGASAMLIALLSIIRLNSRVRRQKGELEKLNEVKDKIFSTISHDLRTPVNSLVSFTQLLEHGSIPPDKLNKYAEALKNNLGYTSELMENLLNWARSQMQGYKPVFETFDIAETILQVVGLLNAEAEKKQVHVVDTIKRGTVVFSDVNMTHLVLRNLLSNAIKYTPQHGSVTLEAVQDDRRVHIRVKDTGIGISQDFVSAFNSATSVLPIDSTPGTNKEKGTGLGLMLCRNFATLMNGSVKLESEEGKGSTFTLSLLKTDK